MTVIIGLFTSRMSHGLMLSHHSLFYHYRHSYKKGQLTFRSFAERDSNRTFLLT